MSRVIPTTALAVLLAAPVLFAQGRGGGNAQPPARIPSIEERTAQMRKMDGYFPLYWDERTGTLFLEIPRFTPNFSTPPVSRPGSGRTISGSTAARKAAASIVLFQRVGPQDAAGAAAGIVPLVEHQPGRAAVGGGFVRQIDPVGIHRRGGESTAACWWTPPISSCATATARPARCGPEPIASTARAARSTWSAPRRFPRTPRSK